MSPTPSLGYNRIQQASASPQIYAKQVVTMTRDRCEFSREESVSLRRSVSRWYDLYRGYVRARSQPFRNQVHLPLLFSAIEAGIAIKHGLLTGQKPYVEFIPTAFEDTGPARKATQLVQQQFDDSETEKKLKVLMRMGDITGCAPYQWSWRYLKNLRPQRVPDINDPTGMAYQVINSEIVDFDGPWWEPVDILDWYPEPGKPDIRTMGWCIRRFWMDLDDVEALMQSGVYDQSAFAELSQAQMSDETSTEFENRRAAPGGLRWSMPNVQQLDKYAKPVEILEMYGNVPAEMVPEDGFRNRLITVANGVALLRNVGNPIWANGLPFGVYTPTEDPYMVYGIGKVEPNDKLQATASRFASQKLDAMDFAIDPMFAYNQLANVQTGKLYARPGGLVGGDGNPSEWLQPIQTDLRGLQQCMAEIEQLWRWMQFGTGITEEAIGMGGGAGSDRQTAREFLGKMENVQRRIVSETLDCARQVLMPLADAFRAMDNQFLSFPKQVRMLGQNAIIDPQTGMPSPPDQSVTLEDVIRRYDMRPASATSLIGRSAKQQNFMLLLQAIGSVPPLMMMTNWQTVGRTLWTVFEENNPDEFIIPMTPQQQLLIQMAQMMTGQKPADSGNPNEGASGAPSQPNAPNDVMDQMMRPEGGFNMGGGPSGASGQQGP